MNKKKYFTISIFSALIILVIINSFSIFASRTGIFSNVTFINSGAANVLFYGLLILLTCPLLSFAITINIDQMPYIGLDQYYLLIFIFGGILQLYYFPYTFLAAISLAIILPLLFKDYLNLKAINKTYWVFILFFTVVFSIGFVLYANNEVSLDRNLIKFIFEIIPISIYEEAIFRWLLTGILITFGIRNQVAFVIQGILFWLVHINYLPISPIAFWIILPIVSFILSYIVYRTKSIALSAVVHIIINYLLFAFQT